MSDRCLGSYNRVLRSCHRLRDFLLHKLNRIHTVPRGMNSTLMNVKQQILPKRNTFFRETSEYCVYVLYLILEFTCRTTWYCFTCETYIDGELVLYFTMVESSSRTTRRRVSGGRGKSVYIGVRIKGCGSWFKRTRILDTYLGVTIQGTTDRENELQYRCQYQGFDARFRRVPWCYTSIPLSSYKKFKISVYHY